MRVGRGRGEKSWEVMRKAHDVGLVFGGCVFGKMCDCFQCVLCVCREIKGKGEGGAGEMVSELAAGIEYERYCKGTKELGWRRR